jgi:hypothetical protein
MVDLDSNVAVAESAIGVQHRRVTLHNAANFHHDRTTPHRQTKFIEIQPNKQ